MNVVMPVRGRPNLTRQAIRTLYNSYTEAKLVVVMDEDDPSTSIWAHNCGANVMMAPDDSHILGRIKNHGVNSIAVKDRSAFLMICDNDCFFSFEGPNITITLSLAHMEGFKLLGLTNHPYNQPIGEAVGGHVKEAQAVSGTCWIMPWSTWDEFGPFVETGAPGIGQSEDFEYCQRIRKAGYRVGSIHPPVVYDCGVVNSDGKPCVGAEFIKRHPEAIYG